MALPPRPRRCLPLDWLLFAHDPLEYLTHIARTYGDVVELTLPFGRVRLLSNPAHVEEMLVKQSRAFKKGNFYALLRPLLGNSVVTSDGPAWQRERRLVQPAFAQARLPAYTETMVSLTERAVQGWHDGDVLDIHWEMIRLTMSIACRLLFDVDVEEQAAAARALEMVLAQFTRSLVSPLRFASPRQQHAIKTLDRLVQDIVTVHRTRLEGHESLLSALLRARDEDGTQMTDLQLRDELVSFFVASHETTALTVTWAWYLLSRHAEGERRLHEEIDSVLSGRLPTLQDVDRLPYTVQVVHETLRLYPVAWLFGREAISAGEIGGYPIRAGQQLWATPWIIHRDPRYYDSPQLFRPERWEDSGRQRAVRGSFLPFGAGPRMCPGRTLALTEAVLILATIAQRFRLERIRGTAVSARVRTTIRPGAVIRLTVKGRGGGLAQPHPVAIRRE